MNFSELLRNRRSVRDYQDREVPLDLVRDIIQDTCLAPSASNGQPWRFIIITDRALMKRISDESKAGLLADLEGNPELPVGRYREILKNKEFNVFYNAPCLVFIAGPSDHRSLYVDCALAAGYLMFAAAERGLGTCWIGLGAHIRSAELRREIGLTDDLRIVAPVIIGYPVRIPDPRRRDAPVILKTITGAEPIAVRVDCYAGYRGEETPRRFWLGENRIGVAEILDRWLAPDHRYFKVRGDDAALYILRNDVLEDRWELTFYRQKPEDGIQEKGETP